MEDNKFPEIIEEEEFKAKKVWKKIGFGALALFLAAITVTVVCL